MQKERKRKSMGKKSKLTPKEEVGILKGAVTFMLASCAFHGLLDDIQHKHWIGKLKEIGTVGYKLDEYEGKVKSFAQILKEEK